MIPVARSAAPAPIVPLATFALVSAAALLSSPSRSLHGDDGQRDVALSCLTLATTPKIPPTTMLVAPMLMSVTPAARMAPPLFGGGATGAAGAGAGAGSGEGGGRGGSTGGGRGMALSIGISTV